MLRTVLNCSRERRSRLQWKVTLTPETCGLKLEKDTLLGYPIGELFLGPQGPKKLEGRHLPPFFLSFIISFPDGRIGRPTPAKTGEHNG
jgi:hypothetical protein